MRQSSTTKKGRTTIIQPFSIMISQTQLNTWLSTEISAFLPLAGVWEYKYQFVISRQNTSHGRVRRGMKNRAVYRHTQTQIGANS